MDGFEWDEVKRLANIAKHGIDFADLDAAFEDPYAITIRKDAEGEERYVTIATDNNGVVVVVGFTWRGDNIRPISARPATNHERRAYEAKR